MIDQAAVMRKTWAWSDVTPLSKSSQWSFLNIHCENVAADSAVLRALIHVVMQNSLSGYIMVLSGRSLNTQTFQFKDFVKLNVIWVYCRRDVLLQMNGYLYRSVKLSAEVVGV